MDYKMFFFIDGNTVGNFENLVSQIKNDSITRIIDDNTALELKSLIKEIKALWSYVVPKLI